MFEHYLCLAEAAVEFKWFSRKFINSNKEDNHLEADSESARNIELPLEYLMAYDATTDKCYCLKKG